MTKITNDSQIIVYVCVTCVCVTEEEVSCIPIVKDIIIL